MKNFTESKNEVIEHEPIAQINKGYVTLPYTHEGFKDFITSLLGRGQEIEKTIRGNFDIDTSNLINIYDLLNQRIKQQNNGNLINFSAKIFFSDESNVTLHSLEELQTYNEIRSVVCIAVHLSWDYLIQFPDKVCPEKQQINILINSGAEQFIRINGKFIPKAFSGGIIRITINHTARTWAVDIESLLQQYLEGFLEKKNSFRKILADKSGYFGLIFGLLFFIAIILISIFTTDQFSIQTIGEVKKYLNNTHLTTDNRINYISNYLARGEWNQFTQKLVLFLIVGSMFSVIFGVIVGFIFDDLNIEHSFIRINNATEKYKEKILNESKDKLWKLAGTIILSLICGVLGNYIFQYLTL